MFPHTSLWYKYSPEFITLIGTPKPLSIDLDDFRERVGSNKAVRDDLMLVDMSDTVALLDGFMIGEENVFRYAGEGPIHTDDLPVVEFFNPVTPDAQPYLHNLRAMIPYREKVIHRIQGNSSLGDDVRRRLETYFLGTQIAIQGYVYYFNRDFQRALATFQRALMVNKRDNNVRFQYLELKANVDRNSFAR